MPREEDDRGLVRSNRGGGGEGWPVGAVEDDDDADDDVPAMETGMPRGKETTIGSVSLLLGITSTLIRRIVSDDVAAAEDDEDDEDDEEDDDDEPSTPLLRFFFSFFFFAIGIETGDTDDAIIVGGIRRRTPTPLFCLCYYFSHGSGRQGQKY